MSKYHSVRVYDPQYGTFDSKGEYERFKDLVLMEKAGLIAGLKRQVPYELAPARTRADGTKQRAVTYVADFRYLDKRTGEWVTEDYKGFRTDAYKIKRAWMYEKYKIDIKETT